MDGSAKFSESFRDFLESVAPVGQSPPRAILLVSTPYQRGLADRLYRVEPNTPTSPRNLANPNPFPCRRVFQPLYHANREYPPPPPIPLPTCLHIMQPGARAKAPAWIEIDPRIRRGLPLVAPPPSNACLPLKETGARLVTVELKYVGEGGIKGGAR